MNDNQYYAHNVFFYICMHLCLKGLLALFKTYLVVLLLSPVICTIEWLLTSILALTPSNKTQRMPPAHRHPGQSSSPFRPPPRPTPSLLLPRRLAWSLLLITLLQDMYPFLSRSNVLNASCISNSVNWFCLNCGIFASSFTAFLFDFVSFCFGLSLCFACYFYTYARLTFRVIFRFIYRVPYWFLLYFLFQRNYCIR